MIYCVPPNLVFDILPASRRQLSKGKYYVPFLTRSFRCFNNPHKPKKTILKLVLVAAVLFCFYSTALSSFFLRLRFSKIRLSPHNNQHCISVYLTTPALNCVLHTSLYYWLLIFINEAFLRSLIPTKSEAFIYPLVSNTPQDNFFHISGNTYEYTLQPFTDSGFSPLYLTLLLLVVHVYRLLWGWNSHLKKFEIQDGFQFRLKSASYGIKNGPFWVCSFSISPMVMVWSARRKKLPIFD